MSTLMWLRRQNLRMSRDDDDGFVTVSGFFPSPEQEEDLVKAIVDGEVRETPFGPRIVWEVVGTDGPDGWSVTLMKPPTFMVAA